jgi:hypothetical protein
MQLVVTSRGRDMWGTECRGDEKPTENLSLEILKEKEIVGDLDVDSRLILK